MLGALFSSGVASILAVVVAFVLLGTCFRIDGGRTVGGHD